MGCPFTSLTILYALPFSPFFRLRTPTGIGGSLAARQILATLPDDLAANSPRLGGNVDFSVPICIRRRRAIRILAHLIIFVRDTARADPKRVLVSRLIRPTGHAIPRLEEGEIREVDPCPLITAELETELLRAGTSAEVESEAFPGRRHVALRAKSKDQKKEEVEETSHSMTISSKT